jgi:Tol biopolymer transport system component/DNA-binding winged helix-turn-helix (wHTH) protein
VSSPLTYEFGDVRVDLGRMVVLKDGRAVPIEPKTFDVLRFLIEHRNRVVMKEELLDAVWRDTFVTPNVLTRAIAQLRKAIGDDARESRYIETVATRGYKFIADVSEVAAVAAVEPEPPVVPDARPMAKPVLIAAAVVVAALAVAALFVASSRRAQPAAGAVASLPEVRRLVGDNSGYFSQPSLSPDGQAVAYVSDKSGPLEIYVAGLAAGSREIAITNDGQQNIQPAWSPDGQWIAYQSRNRGGIWIVPATGGTPRQLADLGSEPAWSPDSQQLVYSSYAGSMSAQANLWIVRRDGSARRALTQIGTPNGGHHQPAWSHDGRFIVFGLAAPEVKASTWIVPAAGGPPRRLNFPGALAQGNPQFSFDDRALYWSGSTPNANQRLWKIALTDAFETAGEAVPVLALDGVPDGLSIARDGRAVYGVFSDDSNLWAVDVRDGSAVREPTRLTNGERNFRASYSTTGRLAYVRVDTGSPPSSWTMKDDGTDQQPLVTDFPAVVPQWVKDGSRLLVLELRPDNAKEKDKLWWVDAATRRTTPIAFDLADAAEPRVSPDGSTLAFHVIKPSGDIQVWSQPLNGGPRKQLTSEAFGVSYPNWSRDGKWLSVQLVKGNDTHVGFMSSAGGRVEQLTDDHGQSWENGWSPDDEWIVYAGERGNVWNLWTVSRRTREQHQLTHVASASGYVRWPVWSPRGDRIVFERDVWTGNVWLTKLP